MKRKAFFISMLMPIFMLSLPSSFAQDSSQWKLPDGATARLGKGSIIDITYAPDGMHFAVVSTIGIWLYDAHTYKETALLTGHTWEEDSVIAFSPDGKTLASASWDDPVRLWDVYTGQLRVTLTGYVNNVKALVFSPDGETLAIANANEILLWDAETGAQQMVLEGHTGSVKAITFVQDGSRLVSASWDGTMRVWDVLRGQHKSFDVKLNKYADVMFSPDGKVLAMVHRNIGKIELWETDTGQFLRTFTTAESVDAIAFLPDGKMLASSGGGPDYLIELWNAQTSERLATFTGHTWIVDTIAFSPDGKTLISGGWNDTIKVWDVETGESRVTLRGHLGWAGVVAFSPDGHTLASGSSPHTIQLWDMDSQRYKTTLEAYAFEVWGLIFSPDGQLLVSGSTEEVLIWGVHTGELHARYQNWYGAIAFSPDGETLASGRFDGTIKLWNVNTIQNWKAVQSSAVLDAHNGGYDSLAYSPDGKILASAGGEGTILLWQTESEVAEDVNGDGNVNIDDLRFVADHLGYVGEGNVADVNGDAVVNILDLVAVAKAIKQIDPANPMLQ